MLTCPPHHLLAVGTVYVGEGRDRCWTVQWRCCRCGYERQEPVDAWAAGKKVSPKYWRKRAKEALPCEQ